MTPKQLEKAGRDLYGEQWQTALARRIGVDDRTVRRWFAGDRAIPAPVAHLIALILRYPKER